VVAVQDRQQDPDHQREQAAPDRQSVRQPLAARTWNAHASAR
jgi:hypothetical protein